MDFNRILLLTAFCCMACDGEIANEEVALLKKWCENDDRFKDIDIDNNLKILQANINSLGSDFLKNYLEALSNTDFSIEQELAVLDIAVKIFYADDVIEYSEVRFFRSIKSHLTLANEIVLEKIEGVEDFWLENDTVGITADDDYFHNIDLSKITIEEL